MRRFGIADKPVRRRRPADPSDSRVALKRRRRFGERLVPTSVNRLPDQAERLGDSANSARLHAVAARCRKTWRQSRGDTFVALLRSPKLVRSWTWESAVDLAHFPNQARTLGAINRCGCGLGGHRKWRQTFRLPSTIRRIAIELCPAMAGERRSGRLVRDGARRLGPV